MLVYKTRTDWMATSQVTLRFNFYQSLHKYVLLLIVAPDSRVLLSSSFPESTYINANYVKVGMLATTYGTEFWKITHMGAFDI